VDLISTTAAAGHFACHTTPSAELHYVASRTDQLLLAVVITCFIHCTMALLLMLLYPASLPAHTHTLTCYDRFYE